MIRHIVFASFLLIAAPVSAVDLHTKPKPECEHTYKDALQIVAAVHGQIAGSKMTEYADADAQKLVDLFNAQPPVTTFCSDRFVVLSDPSGMVMIGFKVGDCFKGPSYLQADQWESFKTQALGAAS